MRQILRLFAFVFAIFSVSGVVCAQEPFKFQSVEHLSGVFFSNFENAKFFLCKSADDPCIDYEKGGPYTLSCDKTVCAALNEKIPDINLTVYLRVNLIGQRSIGEAAPKFLGDPGQVIQVEKIESVTSLQPE